MKGAMALRLDQTSVPSTADEAAAPAAQAASVADRREAAYRAHRAAIEARFAATAAAAPRELPGIYLALAREALDGLAAEPREPLLLNYAGVGLEPAELGADGGGQVRPRALVGERLVEVAGGVGELGVEPQGGLEELG
ncbi:MAG TPA: hypothetical protein VJL81_17280, partial [Solirubrobacterales bacterium]|nr:hypothetical protein [Solirubrobacterales bacterium]